MARLQDPQMEQMIRQLMEEAEAGRLQPEPTEEREPTRSRLNDFRLLLQVLTPKKGWRGLGEPTGQPTMNEEYMTNKYRRTPQQIKLYKRVEEDLKRRGLGTGGKEYNQTVKRFEREMMKRGELRGDPYYDQIEEMDRLRKKHPKMSPEEMARRAHQKVYPRGYETKRVARGGGPLSQLAAWSELIGPALVSRVMNVRYGPDEPEPGPAISEHELGRSPGLPRRPRKPEML